MPTAVHLQLRIVSDDGTVLTDNEIPHLEGNHPLSTAGGSD
jgi:hypothetical protein